MAFLYPLDIFSRNSRSSRHRSYSVPPIMGGSLPNSNDIKHAYRVRPGVVINFVEPASGPRWGPPPRVDHGPPGRPPFPGEFNKDTSWMHSHSPHPRVMRLDDEEYNMDFNPDSRRSPRNRFAPILDDHPDSHYATPFQPAPYPSLFHEPDSVPEMFFDSDDSSQHVPSSTPDSPSGSERSFHSLHSASTDDMPTLHQGYPIADIESRHFDDSRFFDARRSPSPIDGHPPPFRPRRPSFSHSSSNSSTNVRSVRFNENPVLPDPLPRRKGWWNRRGDQLWNNDGAYKPAREDDVYPPDLRNYPEPGVGWMNEEGITIDTKRRLVRKRPLKPALKKASTF